MMAIAMVSAKGTFEKYRTKIVNLYRKCKEDSRPFRRVLAICLERFPIDIGSLVVIKVNVYSYQIALHSTSLSVELWCDSTSRQDDHEFLTEYLKEGDAYVDVGANIGSTLIPAAQSIGCTGTAIGFEPNPKLFAYLNENVVINNLTNVKTFNLALGRHSCKVFLSNEKDDTTNRVVSDASGIEIQMVPLDELELIDSILGEVALLKIDVEGYEKPVLEGALNVLRRTKCIYFEISEDGSRQFHYSPSDLVAILEDLGFQIFVRTNRTMIVPLDKACIHGLFNAFALRDIDDFVKRTGWHVKTTAM